MNKQDEWTLDKAIIKLLSPLLRGMQKLGELFSTNYKKEIFLYRADAPCYCKKEASYEHCCLPKDMKRNRRAVYLVKTHIRTGNEIRKLKFVKNEQDILKTFKAGSVNPLNKDGKYVDTGIDGIGAV